MSRICRLVITILFISSISSGVIYASEKVSGYPPERYGMGITAGNSYNLSGDIGYYMLTGFVLYDYDRVWKHNAPEQLMFKVEGNLGCAHYKRTRATLSANIFALYYLDSFEGKTFKPYVEGGIGIIYTDFQVPGQGMRVNFNPQLGIGAEIKTGSEKAFYMALRLHHISNGGIDDENRGINSVMGMFGFYF